MNKNTHRLIFNKSRGCMMAVLETASSCSQTASGTSRARRSSSRCDNVERSSGFYQLNSPLAQVIHAQAAPKLIVEAGSGLSVSITAGNQFKQVGSDIQTPGSGNPVGSGNIDILAKDIKIIEARETSQSATETKFKQSGLTISISNPILSAAQSAQGLAQAAGNTSDGRMKALAVGADRKLTHLEGVC